MKGKILIVDDEREIRQLLKIILQNAQYEVEEAEDGFVAIEKVYSFRPNVIVLDLMMPEITGFQVCRLLKNDPFFHVVPVIILTALDGQEDRQRSHLTGADYFHNKPIRFADFLELINKCMQEYEKSKKLVPSIPEHLEKPTRTRILHNTNQLLDNHLYQLAALDEIIKAMTGTFELDKVLRMVIKGARRGLGFSRGWIALVNKDKTALIGEIAESSGKHDGDEKAVISLSDNDPQPAALAVKTGKPVIVTQYSMDQRFSSNLKGGLKSECFIDMPFVVKGEAVGILRVDDYMAFKPLTHTRIKLLETFSQQGAIAIDNSRLHKKTVSLTEELQRKIREMEALIQSSHIINSTLERTELLKKIIKVAHEFFNYDNCSILLVDETQQNLYIEAYNGDYHPEMAKLQIPIDDNSITGTVAKTHQSIICSDVSEVSNYSPGIQGGRSELAVPMITRDKLIGVFNVESRNLNAFTAHDEEILKALADQAALAIENSYLVDTLHRMAITDELTTLYNRRHFSRNLEVEMKRAKRYKRPLSIMFFDIDRFKSFNDNYGHKIGDELLKAVSGVLKEKVRTDVDIPARWSNSQVRSETQDAADEPGGKKLTARWGGEEFVVLLPETNEEQAYLSAERFRTAVEQMSAIAPDIPTVTVSIGTATYDLEDILPEELIKRADTAMYNAKENGRNRTIKWIPDLQIRQK